MTYQVPFTLTKFEKTLFCIDIVVVNVMLFILTLECITKRDKWEWFLNSLSDLDEEAELKIDFSLRWKYLLFMSIGHMLYFGEIGCWIYVYSTPFGKYVTYFETVTFFAFGNWVEYSCLVNTLFICNTSLVLKKQFAELNRKFQRYIQSNISEVNLEGKIIRSIRNINKHYTDLAEICDCFNDLFGLKITMVLWQAVLLILRQVCGLFMMHEINVAWTWPAFYLVIFAFTKCVCQVLSMVLCLNSTTMEAIDILKTSQLVEETLRHRSKIAEELKILVRVLEVFKPQFTACGFLVIKKSTLIRLLDVVATNVVVVVEFRSTLAQKEQS
ncbi:unnamed protein product [Acanthoscelides obtectus]|uniref:Gustatory receptor n=1 Tax=Acanthoscelides obtectus TaxID=200917 RepID=A0A9P0KIG9_ACAOB|nr:unnamed protein product [Acanthoscelides obtectus]CAK1648217.1 hypothetical protein AOBTE_LOCUS15609 [Acanthoscelides obtectus]